MHIFVCACLTVFVEQREDFGIADGRWRKPRNVARNQTIHNPYSFLNGLANTNAQNTVNNASQTGTRYIKYNVTNSAAQKNTHAHLSHAKIIYCQIIDCDAFKFFSLTQFRMSHPLINVRRICTCRQDHIMVDGESTTANAVNLHVISIPAAFTEIHRSFSVYIVLKNNKNYSDL